MKTSQLAVIAALSSLAIHPLSADPEVPKGYNTIIPPEILTPDKVDTAYLGELVFDDGRPSEETSQKLYDHLVYLRAVEVFLNWMPACSIEALRVGHLQAGVTEAHHVGITEDLMDSNPLFLTGNTDTVYASAMLDLERDGPTVVEIPPNCGPGTVNDAFFRFVVDMGAPGPDRGQGGKYLILPPDYIGMPIAFSQAGQVVPVTVEGKTESYYVVQSPSYTNWLILRGFLVDGKPDASVKMFKDGLKIYPLKDAKRPPQMKFLNLSKKVLNTIHANNEMFYEELNHVIQKEPVGLVDPELRGLAAAIGIEKGKPFKPDARTAELLKEAAAVGNGMARAISFDARDPAAFIYEDSQWKTAFIGGDYRWLKDGGHGGRYQDARTMFFYFATVNTPAMAAKMVGVGSQYAWIDRDKEGDFLNGSETYRLNIPADVPAKDFWSVVVYDPQTRSQLQTDQPLPSLNSKKSEYETNADGSVDLYFGPRAPEGKEANWIQTVRGKGWFAILRIYGPLESWFDQSWKPGEIELME
ncbi:DUF1254 domain-containing protein [Sulfuriroseicoccus oceanibius]|uniref:DUF1254 domain-containing protein n=1 Tax=Sulfuriroseicoccus oceanibius TaxID=2707525 RepID=A0A6B3L5F7_9BACT|nr:DUF1254 domain-containing protein [Sulfuriroseicoccus oceanibius]QQL44579.1 DUF1254 domain-containing protein [Sulfuriroseicoccus oceanibius]